MVCQVKVNLLSRCVITTDAYSLAVSELEQGTRASSEAGFSDLLKLAHDARRISNDACDNFKKHVSKHGC
jgi:hypothetical protein